MGKITLCPFKTACKHYSRRRPKLIVNLGGLFITFIVSAETAAGFQSRRRMGILSLEKAPGCDKSIFF